MLGYKGFIRVQVRVLGLRQLGVPFCGGPHRQESDILVSIVGSPYLGKLPFVRVGRL